MFQFSAAATVSDEESRSIQSRAVDTLKNRTRDGSILLVAGVVMLARSLRSSGGKGKTAGQILAATTLVGIGLRQRQHHSITKSETEQRGWTGTSEQRADSHEGTNPRDIANERSSDTESDDRNIQFSEDQTETANPAAVSDDHSSGDPRINEETTEIDLSDASMANEVSEAAGPSSVQSQPTQTDPADPEETTTDDSSSEQADGSDGEEDDAETKAQEEDDESTISDEDKRTT